MGWYLLPILDSKRLVLRSISLNDARDIHQLVNHPEVAPSIPVPYPYPDGAAESWINDLAKSGEQGKEFGFAIVRRSDNTFIGSVSLAVNVRRDEGEVGYWLGRAYWGHGYATEAVRCVVDYAFEILKLRRVVADAMVNNGGSIRVLEKAGFGLEELAGQSTRENGDVKEHLHFVVTNPNVVNIHIGKQRQE